MVQGMNRYGGRGGGKRKMRGKTGIINEYVRRIKLKLKKMSIT